MFFVVVKNLAKKETLQLNLVINARKIYNVKKPFVSKDYYT